MNNSLIEKKKTEKYSSVIKILSVIAIVFIVFSFVNNFTEYDLVGNYIIKDNQRIILDDNFEYVWDDESGVDGFVVYDNVNNTELYFDHDEFYSNIRAIEKLILKLPDFAGAIQMLWQLTPFVLFIICTFICKKSYKTTILIFEIFAILLLGMLEVLLISFRNLFSGYFYYYYWLNVLLFVAYIVAIISTYKGFKKKALIIIALLVCLMHDVIGLMDYIFMLGDTFLEALKYLHTYAFMASGISYICFNVALLLFVTNNSIPSFTATMKINKSMNPQQALRILKDKLDCGMITKEEYNTQRADIINNL